MSAHRALWLALCVFAFFLPVGEAPKNLAAGAVLGLWLLQAVRTRDAGGPWDMLDTAFAVYGTSAVLSAVIGGYGGALGDVFRVIAVAWCVKRAGFSAREGRAVLVAACAGLVVALAAGAVPFLLGREVFLELPSVGQVNQSALYIALLAATTLGWASQAQRWPRRSRWTVAALASLFCLGLVVTASRAAILAYGVFALGLAAGLLWGGRQNLAHHRVLLLGLAGAVLASALVLGLRHMPASAEAKKFEPSRLVSAASIHIRMQHWALALEAWHDKPWFGHGPASFGRFDVAQACAWRAGRGLPCDPQDYTPATHAHSLYIATLAERGLIGIAALLFVLAVWGRALAGRMGQARRSPLWMAGAAGLVVVVVGGLFNTTLRVEHGSLALLMLALWCRPGLPRARGLAAARPRAGAARSASP